MARKLKSDKVLFLATLLLVCSSVVMVYSASAVLAMNRFNQPYFFLIKQAMWAVLGLAAMSLAMRFDYRNYREPSFIWMALGVVVLALVADADGAGHPSTMASVVVAILVVSCGPALMAASPQEGGKEVGHAHSIDHGIQGHACARDAEYRKFTRPFPPMARPPCCLPRAIGGPLPAVLPSARPVRPPGWPPARRAAHHAGSKLRPAAAKGVSPRSATGPQGPEAGRNGGAWKPHFGYPV